MRNLAAIADALTDVPSSAAASWWRRCASDYLPALVRLFATVDLESRPDLHHLYNIFKGALYSTTPPSTRFCCATSS